MPSPIPIPIWQREKAEGGLGGTNGLIAYPVFVSWAQSEVQAR
jgi:hypothetical protein